MPYHALLTAMYALALLLSGSADSGLREDFSPNLMGVILGINCDLFQIFKPQWKGE